MVLNRMFGEGDSRGELANPGLPGLPLNLHVCDSVTSNFSDVCRQQELVHSRQQLSDDRVQTQTAIDNLKRCFRLMQ